MENWRRFHDLSEEDLLAEGILQNVEKKYPRLAAKDLGYIERLSRKDPSGRNKYLMWMARELNLFYESLEGVDGAGAPGSFASSYQFIEELVEEITMFHNNKQRIKLAKLSTDINTYKDLESLKKVNREIGFSKSQQRRDFKEEALKDVIVLIDNDAFTLERPLSVNAAAVLGGARGATSWCISRGNCETPDYNGEKEWFSEYTGEGKSFYYILSKFLPRTDSGDPTQASMMALTVNDGSVEAINDRNNDDISQEQFSENIKIMLFASVTPHPHEAVKIYDDMSTGEETPEIIQKVAEGLVEIYGADYDESVEDITDVDEVYEIIERILSMVESDIDFAAVQSAEDDPAGHSQEDYDSVLAEFNWDEVQSGVSVDDSDGEGHYYMNGWMDFELPENLEWVDIDGESADADDYEDEIIEVFKSIAEDNDVYIESHYGDEVTFDNWSNDERISMRFNPDNEESSGGMDGFRDFCKRIWEYGEKHEEILEEAIEEMVKIGYITSEGSRFRQSFLESLPDLKNLDKVLDKGVLKVFSEFDLKVPGLLKDLGFFDLKTPAPRPKDQIGILTKSPLQDTFLSRQKALLGRAFRGGQPFTLFFNELLSLYNASAEKYSKQVELPLQESEEISLPDDFIDPEFGQLLAVKMNGDDGGSITGTLVFSFGFNKVYDENDTRAIVGFLMWLDNNLERAYQILIQITQDEAKKLGEKNKENEPDLFKDGASSVTTENKKVSYQTLCENWRKFVL